MKSIAHENRQKALLYLVSCLNETVPTPIEVVPFCLKYNIDSSFLDALRDLDCLILLPVGVDEVMRFTRTAKLLSITVDEVLSMEKRLKKAKGKPEIVIDSPMLRRALASSEMPPDGAFQLQAEPGGVSGDSLTHADAYAMGYVAAGQQESAPRPQAEPKPYPRLSGTVPMLDSHSEAASYCADVIFAHADNEPHDMTGLLAAVVDQLKARQLSRAQELRGEAAAMLSRAEAFEQAAQTTF